jgi:hypothetical protein
MAAALFGSNVSPRSLQRILVPALKHRATLLDLWSRNCNCEVCCFWNVMSCSPEKAPSIFRKPLLLLSLGLNMASSRNISPFVACSLVISYMYYCFTFKMKALVPSKNFAEFLAGLRGVSGSRVTAVDGP